MSSGFFWSWLARSKVGGANACARRSEVGMARSDAVANAQRAGRFPTEARLCPELRHEASFFLIFFQLFLGQTLPCEKTGNSWHRCLVAVASGRLIVGKIIWPIL